MPVFITYFDYLGYKDFILNNPHDYVRRRVLDILRDIEMSLGQGNFQEPRNGMMYPDLSNSKINCLNISDTVIFWTNDDSLDSFEDLIKISYNFNWRENCYNMPIRGAMVYAEMEMIRGQVHNNIGGFYSPNIIYGKGLINAHSKAESLNWAGSVIDVSVINRIKQLSLDFENLISPYAISYNVPYKNDVYLEEYAFRLVSGTLNQEAFENRKRGIENTFSRDNKDANKPRVVELRKHTIEFLTYFLEKKVENKEYNESKSIIDKIIDFTEEKVESLVVFFKNMK